MPNQEMLNQSEDFGLGQPLPMDAPRQQALNDLVAMRTKTWDERTPEEKLEVLRDALRSKDMAIQDLRDQLARLMQHSHGKNGELLSPIYPYGGIAPAYPRYDPLA